VVNYSFRVRHYFFTGCCGGAGGLGACGAGVGETGFLVKSLIKFANPAAETLKATLKMIADNKHFI
jgi:hypothetical protein